jgi:uncharacterized protein YdhG (YjbR/CyaY superfamily)
MESYRNIDEYLANFPASTQKLLTSVRKTIQQVVPQAQEAIKYGIPTFTLDGNLVHFAAFKSHIGLYPGPSGIIEFKEELSGYHTSKGAIQFPFDQPLPLALIKKIVEFRVKEKEMTAKKTAKSKGSARPSNATAGKLKRKIT